MLLKLICRGCGHVASGAPLGSRCPADGQALVPVAEHRAYPDDPMLGRVVAGKYPIVGVIGMGGMGAVYRALQEPVGRYVAIRAPVLSRPATTRAP